MFAVRLSFWSKPTKSSLPVTSSRPRKSFGGAVSQAAMAVGKQRKVPANKSYQRREMAKDLTEEYGEPLIASQYSVAEKFHANFYHDFMEDAEIEADRPQSQLSRPSSD